MINILKTVFTVDWIVASGIRAIKTFAQSMISLLGADQLGIVEADWSQALSIAAMAFVLSLLTSIAGLPELKSENKISA